MNNINEIKAKIAKLLRMQGSNNENEAANAALLVEKLCQQHGISTADVTPDYDPEKDQAIAWDALVYGKRRDAAEVQLLNNVAGFFNGITITKYRMGKNIIEVIATKGRRLEIEIYFEYLLEQMNQQADKAKAVEDPDKLDRAFKRNFRKAFVYAVKQRLRQIETQREREEMEAANKPCPAGTTAPGLVIAKRRNIEGKAVDALCRKLYPRLGTCSGFTGARGTGADSGRAAGQNVGLNKQVNKGQTLALAGR